MYKSIKKILRGKPVKKEISERIYLIKKNRKISDKKIAFKMFTNSNKPT